MSPAAPPARPLRHKLTALAMALTLAPLAAVGWAVYDVNERALEERIREFQLAIAGDIGRTLGGEQQDGLAGLAAVRRVLVDGDLDDETRIALATALVGADPSLDHVAIYGPDGTLIDALIEDGAAVRPSPTLSEAMRLDARRGSATGPARPGADARSPPRLPLALAIVIGGRPTGYLTSAVSLAPIEARLRQLARGYFAGQPDPLMIVDLQHRLVSGGDGRIGEVVDAPALASLTPSSHAAGAAPSRIYEAADGRAVVAAVVPIAGTPWWVVVQQSTDVVFASLATTRLVVWATVLLALLAAWIAAWFVARRLTAPVRALVAFTERLAARDFDAPLEIATRDELSTLGRALTDAAADLRRGEAQLAAEAAIRADLGRYLPAELVDKVVDREQDMALGGRRMEITVMFADVVGFTPLSERLPPETVVHVLNELFSLATEIVFRHGGIVDKFIGDCIMAVWGAPDPRADHAARALAAAEEIVRWIEVGAAGWREVHGVDLALAIGINSGEAVVGNVGSDRRMEYTAIGDTVNIAARLEGIARPMQILITEETRRRAGEDFDYAFVERRTVTGREAPVDLYEVRV